MHQKQDKKNVVSDLIKKGWTKKDISKSLGIPEKVISKIAKDCDLVLKKAYSHGSDHIYDTLKILFPYMHIEREFHVTSGLRIDVYIPQHKIGFEFDGEQHSTFNKFFHGTIDNFEKAKSLDKNKEYFCSKYGIQLIRFTKAPTNQELINYVSGRIQSNI